MVFDSKGVSVSIVYSFFQSNRKSRKAYYDALAAVEDNRKYSGRIDVTPFLLYFIDNVYNKLKEGSTPLETLIAYEKAVKDSKITGKKTKLWKSVLS